MDNTGLWDAEPGDPERRPRLRLDQPQSGRPLHNLRVAHHRRQLRWSCLAQVKFTTRTSEANIEKYFPVVDDAPAEDRIRPPICRGIDVPPSLAGPGYQRSRRITHLRPVDGLMGVLRPSGSVKGRAARQLRPSARRNRGARPFDVMSSLIGARCLIGPCRRRAGSPFCRAPWSATA